MSDYPLEFILEQLDKIHRQKEDCKDSVDVLVSLNELEKFFESKARAAQTSLVASSATSSDADVMPDSVDVTELSQSLPSLNVAEENPMVGIIRHKLELAEERLRATDPIKDKEMRTSLYEVKQNLSKELRNLQTEGGEHIDRGNPDEGIERLRGRCSWCFKKTFHDLVEYSFFWRSRYKCTNCLNQTVQCRFDCGALGRRTDTSDDDLCLRCCGAISSWQEAELSARQQLNWPCSSRPSPRKSEVVPTASAHSQIRMAGIDLTEVSASSGERNSEERGKQESLLERKLADRKSTRLNSSHLA